MPDFTPTEIDLARQLALPREFREGDWVIGRGRYAGTTFAWADWSDPYPIHGDTAALANRGVEGAEWVWLPSVEDCFELLREEDVELLRLFQRSRTDPTWVADGVIGPVSYHVHVCADANTPREALYRLLLEVRG